MATAALVTRDKPDKEAAKADDRAPNNPVRTLSNPTPR
jgi:hypothetical protein